MEEKQYLEIRCSTCNKLWFKAATGSRLDFQIKCGGWCNGLHFVELTVGEERKAEIEEIITNVPNAGATGGRDRVRGLTDTA